MNNTRIAVAITRAPLGCIQDNLDRVAHWASVARQKQAQLICFPELNVSGYTASNEIQTSAQPVPGPISDAVSQLAIEQQIAVLAGMAETGEDGLVHVSHLVAQPHGSLGIYRKLHIAPPEKTVLVPGKRIPLFKTPQIRFGIQLCYDAHFPGLSTKMAVDGMEVLFVPHASPHGTPEEKYRSWMRHLPARAYDNSVFVVACNQTGDNGGGLRFPGVAVVFGPDGRVIEKILSDKENLLVVDLKRHDFNRVRQNRMHFFLPHRWVDGYR